MTLCRLLWLLQISFSLYYICLILRLSAYYVCCIWPIWFLSPMKFVPYDVCRHMTFVVIWRLSPYYICLIWRLSQYYDVCRNIMTFVAYNVGRSASVLWPVSCCVVQLAAGQLSSSWSRDRGRAVAGWQSTGTSSSPSCWCSPIATNNKHLKILLYLLFKKSKLASPSFQFAHIKNFIFLDPDQF